MDMIDLSQAKIFNSPPDIASWPVTRQILNVTEVPTSGFSASFDSPLPDAWKWMTGNGSDNYQYTFWIFVKVGGNWCGSGFVEMWQGRDGTGKFEATGSFPGDWGKNYAYDAVRWGDMVAYRPTVGDSIGIMVSAGDARGKVGVSSVRERSNVVLFTLPPNDVGQQTYQQDSGTTIPPPPVPPPSQPPSDAPGAILEALKGIAGQLVDLSKQVATLKAELDTVQKQAGTPIAFPAYSGSVFGVTLKLNPTK